MVYKMSIKEEQKSEMPKLYTPITQDWCETQIKVDDFNFTWIINSFSTCAEKVGEKLSSTFFSKDNKVSWCLDLYPRGRSIEYQDYLSLYLIGTININTKINANCKFFILNNKMEETNELKFNYQYVCGRSEYGFREFIRREIIEDEKNNLLPDDKLMILCKISAEFNRVNVSSNDAITKIEKQSKLSSDLQILYENHKFSDFTLNAEGKKFPVHKALLASRSPVFSAMFEHEMKEKKENVAEITDINSEVLTELLRYIYTEKVENLQKMANDLLIASDMYALEELKLMCEEVLCNSLTVNNAIDTLIIADFHNADNLKTHTIKFIVDHSKDIVKTPGFKNISHSHSHVITEVFEAMALKS